MGIVESFKSRVPIGFNDQPQRDWPDDDCSELSRSELRAGRISWDYMSNTPIVGGPQPKYYGFPDAPEPAPTVWRPKLDRLGVALACTTIILGSVSLLLWFFA